MWEGLVKCKVGGASEGYLCLLQVKYKDAVRQQSQSSLYHQLSETTETQRAKQQSELQSQVGGPGVVSRCDVLQAVEPRLTPSARVHLQNKYQEAGKREASAPLYSLLPHTMETLHAKDAARLLSEVRSRHRGLSPLPEIRLGGPGS